MKITDLIESEDWDNASFENKKAEIAHLEKQRKAVAHYCDIILQKLESLKKKDLVADQDGYGMLTSAAQREWTQIRSTGPLTKWKRYWVRNTNPELLKKIDGEFTKASKRDAELKERIQGLTVRGNSYCFTGFRDADLERKITRLGGEVKSSAVNGLTYLIAKDPSRVTGKMLKAKEQGTKIISQRELEDFLRD